MKVQLDCFPCFLKQALIALRLGTNNEVLQETILKEITDYIKTADTSMPPAYTTTFIHRKIRQMLGGDPFAEIKAKYNKLALELYDKLTNITSNSGNPLLTASKLAIAGNVIDFGIFTSIDIESTINRALNNELEVDDSEEFIKSVSEINEILYLLDNAGEIVFDRILIETLIKANKRVKAVVKGSAVINDATMFDAEEAGLTGVCEVIDNGSDAVGTILQWTSKKFQDEFNEAQMIISKGQGNFETLLHSRKNIYFLFQSKCRVVSKELGLDNGAMLLMKG
ncbi:MAG: DUF89 family protein [Nitrospirae bacterium]|jgi:uncharacterized protein with ATP-grasp and redox domains|nr:DUF89 family protein [Nitrospirota bacterium]